MGIDTDVDELPATNSAMLEDSVAVDNELIKDPMSTTEADELPNVSAVPLERVVA
jgi:hypothetical protein